MELPYSPRPGQLELVQTIHDAQTQGRSTAVESPTGTGKTIAALVASLQSAKLDGSRIVYATRTNTQQAQVVREHHALRLAGHDSGLLVPFMGRRHYCPLLADDDRFRDGTAEELGRLCRDAKRKAIQEMESGEPVEGSCPYYRKLMEDGTGPVESLLRQGMDASTLGRRIASCGSCPYEALKALLPQADVVVVPAVFVIDDRLRNTLMSWLGTGPDGVHLVLDEAHNFPTAVQEHHSPRLAAGSIQRAVAEAERLQDPVLAGRILTTSFLNGLTRAILGLADEFILCDADDALVPPGALEERLMEILQVPSTVIMQAASELETWGDIIRERQRAAGRLPRSYLGAMGTFLHGWWAAQDAPYAHLVEREPLAVEAHLLHPGAVLGWLGECASTTHMSGTLAPTDEYVARCNLPATTVQQVFPSPFAADQLSIVGLHGVHRRWQAHQDDPGHAERQQMAARTLLDSMPGRTALWFPSHAMLRDYLEEGFLHGLGRSIHAEQADMTHAEAEQMMNRFKEKEGAILLGVLGGRLSEGIDFPGDALEHALVFGIPYPRPTARLQAEIHHNDRLHDGQGWTYAVHNPVGRRIRQAIGRLVRGPSDRGQAVILDERIARFRGHLPNLVMVDVAAQALDPPRPKWGFQSAGTLQEGCSETEAY